MCAVEALRDRCPYLATVEVELRDRLATYCLLLVCVAGLACAPDEELEHPCLEGSGTYTSCELVEPGGGCNDDAQCKGELAQCVGGKCECLATCAGKSAGDGDGCGGCCLICAGKECGDDGCGGSCGSCETGWQCGGDQLCFQVPWTDSSSGLTWQITPTGGIMKWSDAKTHCSGLDLGGHTDWHLPTISELRTLIRGCPGSATGGACEVTDSCLSHTASCFDQGACWSCSDGRGPADGCYWPDEMQGTCSWYWSSSLGEDYGNLAWNVYFGRGSVNDAAVTTDRRARCVR